MAEDIFLAATVGQRLGDVLALLKEHDQARRQYESAMPLFQQVGSHLGEARCIQALGDIHRDLGEYDHARRLYESAMPLFQQIGAKSSEAICHVGLIACYRKLGMANEYHQNVVLARELMAKESVYNRACFASVC